MKVFAFEDCGGSKVLKCKNVQLPRLKEDEVVILIWATGVNKMDVMRAQHDYELPKDWSPVPGLECTGEIIDVGEKVHDWKVGDEVCALLNGGGYASAVVVRATQVLPLPLPKIFSNLLASLPEVACTTWEAISRLSKLSANMTLLVYERSGKFCDLAIQLAEMVQARVIIARDELTFNKRYSSHASVKVNSPQFFLKVREKNGNKGVDVILDCDVSTVNDPRALKSGGTVVIVNLGPVKVANVDLRNLRGVNGVLHVVNRMWWSPKYMAEVVSDMREKMWPSFSNGILDLPGCINGKGEGTAGRVHFLSEAPNAQIGDVLTPI